jgi:hypothetical protein
MPAQPSPRRRFQFRLRTLLIVVTLLAVPLGYVGWQAKIVHERQVMMRWVEEHDGYCLLAVNKPVTQTTPAERPSLIRRWLGDAQVAEVCFRSLISHDDAARIREAFPGVQIRYTGLPDPVAR